MTVHCQPLTPTEYAPYGGVISTDVVTDRTVVVNNGTARRTPEVVPTLNLYHNAPSQTPAKTVLNVSLASPRPTHDDGGRQVFSLTMLERHPYSTQSFVPMGADVRYLVVVTDSDASNPNAPDLTKLRGFVAGTGQGVCYAPGVWHAPLCVVDKAVSFVIVQHVNGVADEDCEFFPLDEAINVVF